MIKFLEWIKALPSFVKWVAGAALAVVFALFLWWVLTGGWNKIGNYIFHSQINAERVKVQQELAEVPELKRAIETTLLQLKESKAERDAIKAEYDRLEGIFNDQSKTAAQKVAEFKAAVTDDPVRTATDNITTNDLCERAKAIGASSATIDSLCR